MNKINLIAVISIVFLITGCQSIPNDDLYYGEEINDNIEREDEITRRQVYKKKVKRDASRSDGEPLNDSVIQEDSILKVHSTKKKMKKKKKNKAKRALIDDNLDDEIERDPIQDFD